MPSLVKYPGICGCEQPIKRVWIVHVHSAVQGVYTTHEAATQAVQRWAVEDKRKAEGWHEVHSRLWASDHHHLTINPFEVRP